MSDEQPTKTYRMTVPVDVEVTVTDAPVGDTDDGPMHPLDPRRMEGIYDLSDPAAMLQHLAYNAVSNGLRTASALDGWGDISVLPDEATDWPKWQRTYYVDDHHPVRMRVVDVDTGGADHWDAPPTTDDLRATASTSPGDADPDIR
jgi:hypothetical protein